MRTICAHDDIQNCVFDPVGERSSNHGGMPHQDGLNELFPLFAMQEVRSRRSALQLFVPSSLARNVERGTVHVIHSSSYPDPDSDEGLCFRSLDGPAVAACFGGDATTEPFHIHRFQICSGHTPSLSAAVIWAGKALRKLDFGKKGGPVLAVLRRSRSGDVGSEAHHRN